MLVGDLGEFDLIDQIATSIKKRNDALAAVLEADGTRLNVGIGDDAAVWNPAPGLTVATTDTMVEGVHFITDQIGWRDLGWKSFATNLSDIGAMGCHPTFALVTLGLHEALPIDGLLEMYSGMLDACEYAGGVIAGGDIVKSPVFFITVALEGRSVTNADGNYQILRRDAAEPGDLIAVTGSVGCSGAGLKILSSNDVSPQLSVSNTLHFKQAHFHPYPRVAEGVALARSGVKSAMDISDGLLADLEKLCKESGVGATIRSEKVPVDLELHNGFPETCLDLALRGGEDYELLFTAPASIMEIATGSVNIPVSIIGEIHQGTTHVVVVDKFNTSIDMGTSGWDHFLCD